MDALGFDEVVESICKEGNFQCNPNVKSNCVTIPAQSYVNKKPNNWKVNSTALVYRPYIKDPKNVSPKGSDPLVYKFQVLRSGKYAITMDSESAAVTNFNDVWIGFSEQQTLRKVVNGTTLPLITGFNNATRAYQNSAGRTKAAFSISHNYHSIETAFPLMPGLNYTITVQGRSPRMKLFGLILFPCEGDDCWHGSSHHQAFRRICNV